MVKQAAEEQQFVHQAFPSYPISKNIIKVMQRMGEIMQKHHKKIELF